MGGRYTSSAAAQPPRSAAYVVWSHLKRVVILYMYNYILGMRAYRSSTLTNGPPLWSPTEDHIVNKLPT